MYRIRLYMCALRHQSKSGRQVNISLTIRQTVTLPPPFNMSSSARYSSIRLVRVQLMKHDEQLCIVIEIHRFLPHRDIGPYPFNQILHPITCSSFKVINLLYLLYLLPIYLYRLGLWLCLPRQRIYNIQRKQGDIEDRIYLYYIWKL